MQAIQHVINVIILFIADLIYYMDLSKLKVRHVGILDMLGRSTILASTTESTPDANETTTTETTLTTSSSENLDSVWIAVGASIGAFLFAFVIFAASMAVFFKWRSKRRSEGAYNPSREETQGSRKNQVVFAIPLPNPERLI